MTVDGLGEAYKDPYDFISGGLYDDHVGEVRVVMSVAWQQAVMARQ